MTTKNPDACYECGRTGHIKKYCPQLKNKTTSSNSRDFKKNKFKSRKALLTWDESDESDKEVSEDDDVAQLCFMVNDDNPKLQNEKELKLVKIQSDHGGEFEKDFIPFGTQNGISHEFSASRTPQQNELKWNMLQPEAVVPKYCGCVKLYKILVSQ
ncbi:hypothetical protein RJ640_007477 [Escallonia rubra]|uniref:CCHC-type domain-containing protein n=1 Tax=Escallonia rubra TaxID=112253 RepID=A0AA88RGB9_9ASTE|nr:hypothetical protein RJ640_007477 [Escallonia rubra]